MNELNDFTLNDFTLNEVLVWTAIVLCIGLTYGFFGCWIIWFVWG